MGQLLGPGGKVATLQAQATWSEWGRQAGGWVKVATSKRHLGKTPLARSDQIRSDYDNFELE